MAGAAVIQLPCDVGGPTATRLSQEVKFEGDSEVASPHIELFSVDS
jgi:hypothetical protein